MRLLVLLGALAVASAEYQQPYYGPQHIPVIQNGVPVETPEVQAARAAHFAAFSGGAAAHVAPYAGAGQYNGNAQYNNPAPQQGRYTPPAYQTSHTQPSIGQNGVPQDTPEVEAAKAHHFAAYSQQHAALGQALANAQPAGYGGHYRKRRSVYGGYGYAHAVPVIGHNGVPLDTPEVQHAKAAHFAAVAQATARTGHGGYGGYAGGDDGGYDGAYAGHGGYAPAYHGPIHIPVIGPNGVPVDTPEVQHARAAHLAALNGAGHGYGYGAGAGHAVPVDTPEVQHARAAHFAAYAAAAHGGHGHY